MSEQFAIRVTGLSKKYQIGKIGAGSLRRDLLRNMRNWYSRQNVEKEDTIWALRSVDFTIMQGEAWGIIGNNGAGKSTLLKILSRITPPTSGMVEGYGRLSALLEVGTGFHADLSGRENIYISGYMLGMSKAEITQRFDEIVAFSGVENFLDTPVKRYSSGMYVRLAFGVAAHLEPDILLVDEVLAVGDVAFQQKCMGKMKEASQKEGRTVVFVSHNLPAVQQLCTNAVWLHGGEVKTSGRPVEVLAAYMNTVMQNVWFKQWEATSSNELVSMQQMQLKSGTNLPGSISRLQPVEVHFSFRLHEFAPGLYAEVLLFDAGGACVFAVTSPPFDSVAGLYGGSTRITAPFLNDGTYTVSFAVFAGAKQTLAYYNHVLRFTVTDIEDNTNYYVKWWGQVRPDFPVSLKRTDD